MVFFGGVVWPHLVQAAVPEHGDGAVGSLLTGLSSPLQYVVTKLKVGAARKLREEADAKAKEAAAKAEEALLKKAKEAGELCDTSRR